MSSPNPEVALPLDYAAELAFEMHLMRAECSEAAQRLVEQTPLDEAGLEECARLEETLAQAQRLLSATVERIRASRAERE